MAAFEGFTFDPAKGSAPISPAARSKKIDMDLNDLVKEDRAAKRGNRKPNQGKPNPASPRRNTGAASPKPGNTGDGGKKRSWDIEVPEAALRTLLQTAGVDVPEGVALKLIARKKNAE
jgi:hypothetical protein